MKAEQVLSRWNLCLALLMAALASPIHAQTYKVIYAFTGGGDGAFPTSLTIDRHGNLYGTTQQGGAYGHGTAFALSQRNGAWVVKPLHNFASDEEIRIVWWSRRMNGSTARLEAGPLNAGSVFRLTPLATFCSNILCPWTETILHVFTGSPDGNGPYGPVNFDAAGNVYGTAAKGGADNSCSSGCGTIF